MTHAATHDHGFDPPPSIDNTWTEERVTLLTELRNANRSRSDIAITINNKTGSNYTRSAVSGQIKRRFPTQAKPVMTPEERAASERASDVRYNDKRREQRRQARTEARLEPYFARTARPFAVVAFNPEEHADANVVGIANLEPHHCRWIFGDDVVNPTFCGLHVLEGSSYCSGHHRMVYLKPLPSKRVYVRGMA